MYQRLGSAGLVSLIFEGFKHGSFTLVGLVFREIPWISISRPKKSLVGPAIGPGPLSKRLWRDQGRDPRSEGKRDTPNRSKPRRPQAAKKITTRTGISFNIAGCKMYPDCLGDVYISYKKMGGIFNPPAMLGTTSFLVALFFNLH